MISRSRLYAILMAITMLLAACNTDLDEETTLTFVGDSIISRWDLQSYFSSLATTNLGRSGAGIDYIERMAGSMRGKNVVILIGTNNNNSFRNETTRKEFEQRYIAAINALEAKKIYLYDVLPREFHNDDAGVNDYIRMFNNDIAEYVSTRPDIVYMKLFDLFIADNNHINQQYYNDGLHLSPEGYEVLAVTLFNNL